jgi:hypothetical protein
LTAFRQTQRISAAFLICAATALAHVDNTASSQPVSWTAALWQLPLLRFFAPAVVDETELLAPVLAAVPALPACSVEPLSPIHEPEALEFEREAGSLGVVDVDGLRPATALALSRFYELVTAVGGNLIVTSAYRPAAYQQHLQEVWDKWMFELRSNEDPACQILQAQVFEEFTRHELLESQRPATASDHTHGEAFDAAVILPRRHARKIDRFARLAGIRRPHVRTDPVHFKLL